MEEVEHEPAGQEQVEGQYDDQHDHGALGRVLPQRWPDLQHTANQKSSVQWFKVKNPFH